MTLSARSDTEVILKEDTFTEITTWINYYVDSRNKNIYQLLQKVRFALVKAKNLATVIAIFSACESSTDCELLIMGKTDGLKIKVKVIS